MLTVILFYFAKIYDIKNIVIILSPLNKKVIEKTYKALKIKSKTSTKLFKDIYIFIFGIVL